MGWGPFQRSAGWLAGWLVNIFPGFVANS